MKRALLFLSVIIPWSLCAQIQDYFPNSKQLQFEVKHSYRDSDFISHYVTYYPDGKKREEHLEKNHDMYDTMRAWTEEGYLEKMNIYTDTGYTAFYFYEDGTVWEAGRYLRSVAQPEYREIYDSAKFDKYYTASCNLKCLTHTCHDICYERIGIWKTYHPNGIIESEGHYLPMEFRVDYPMKDSSGTFVMVEKTSFEIERGVICSAFLKDGVWFYYDPNGILMKVEIYFNGKLKQVIKS